MITPLGVYGPTGQHWPDRTTALHADGPRLVEAACTWADIAAAIRSFTPDEDGRVLVQPGTLPGYGGSAGSKAVLVNVGTLGRPRRIVVTPRDGRGTVLFSDAIRLDRVHNVCLAGFNFQGITLTGCSESAVAWSTTTAWRLLGQARMETRGVQMVEVVIPDPVVGNSDPAGYGAGYVPDPAAAAQGSGALTDCHIIGGYHAPQYRPIGGPGHNDTLQMYGGGGIYDGLTITDTALFGSSNCALQIGGFSTTPEAAAYAGDRSFLTLTDSLLLAPQFGQIRYPIPEGAEPPKGQAINGAGRPGHLHATRVVAPGAVYGRSVWGSVTESVCSSAPAGSGWTITPDLAAEITAEWLDRWAPEPTAERLARIWPAPKVEPEPDDPTPEPEPEPTPEPEPGEEYELSIGGGAPIRVTLRKV